MNAIEAIRLKIEQKIEECTERIESSNNSNYSYIWESGFRTALKEIFCLIDSLQQEQQEVDLDKEVEEYWIATGWSKVITLGKFKVIARYFYGLGQLNS